MAEDFSEHPTSITELKANRSQRAADWLARDALIDMLRRIDSGEIKPTTLIICAGTVDEGGTHTHYSNFAPNVYHSLGLLERVKTMLQQE